MKKLFLMLVVLFLALCLFVSCDDDSSDKEAVSTWDDDSSDKTAVSTWRTTIIDDDDPYYDVDNFELVFYDDGTFTIVNNYIYKINGVVEEEGTSSIEGTYTATSDTTGTYTYTYQDEIEEKTITVNGSYIIDGNIIQMTEDNDGDIFTTYLTKVEE